MIWPNTIFAKLAINLTCLSLWKALNQHHLKRSVLKFFKIMNFWYFWGSRSNPENPKISKIEKTWKLVDLTPFNIPKPRYSKRLNEIYWNSMQNLTRFLLVIAINFTRHKISAIGNFWTLVKQYASPQKLAIRKPFAGISRLTQIPAFPDWI